MVFRYPESIGSGVGRPTRKPVNSLYKDESMTKLEDLVSRARACTLCAGHLPLGPRPVFQVSPRARVLVAAQAPGTRVHETGIPFNDPSGDRLRDWMGVDTQTFYDASRIAILPMGFCYPGRGTSGDLPPRSECAPAWRKAFLSEMPSIELTLVIGQYAQAWHFGKDGHKTLTARVAAWREAPTGLLPMPHPSPRNRLWLRKNPWFEGEVVPDIRRRVALALASDGKGT